MGRAEIDPSGEFEAGSYQSFRLIYTAGRFGIDDSGSLKVVFRFACDMAPLQFDKPAADNYVTVQASNDAVLECRYDPKGNIRPWDKTLYVKVVSGFLKEGDTIVVRLGDRGRGSRGLRLQTFREKTFEFRVLVDAMATYNYVELPRSPEIAIVPGPPVSNVLVLPSIRRIKQHFRLCLKTEDRWGNPSDKACATFRLEASIPVEGLPETVTFKPGEYTVEIAGLRVVEPGTLVIDLKDGDGKQIARGNPLKIVDVAGLLPYWGDLHGQSEETLGTNSVREYFDFARGLAFLDICGHQANDFQVTNEFWNQLNSVTGEFNESGKFVAIPGYEWSGNTALGGDRNVFYPQEGRTIRRSSHALLEDLSDAGSDCFTAAELLEKLAAEDSDAVVIAHAGGRYSDIRLAHDGRVERSIEIHSAWGTFEWLLHDAFELGYRIGIVANSDGHKGRPGASYPGASWFGAYGGLTCFLLPVLTRDAVFDCLRKRRHYATTGARIILDVRSIFRNGARRFDDDPALGPTRGQPVRDALMGDIVHSEESSLLLRLAVTGTSPIERVEVFNGRKALTVIRPHAGIGERGRRLRVIWEGAEYRGRFRQTNWDGRAKIEGNRVLLARPINFFRPDQHIEHSAENELYWQARTTGNMGGFDVWLESSFEGKLRIVTPHVECELLIREIDVIDRVFDAGKLGRRLRIFRLPDNNPHYTVETDLDVEIEPGRDNPLYVKVTQEDGHQAWSSPIWLIPEPPAN